MNSSARASSSSVEIPGRTARRISSRVAPTIRPARAMMSISLGDLSVIIVVGSHCEPPSAAKPKLRARASLASNLPFHPLRDLFHRAYGRNLHYPAPFPVPLQHRSRLLPVRPEPPLHRLGIVVRAPF